MATNYRAVGAVDIVQAVATAHAVDIVHAVHTLDIAIAIVIVIAKATNTRFGWPEMAIPGGGLPEQSEMAIAANLGKKLKNRETVI